MRGLSRGGAAWSGPAAPTTAQQAATRPARAGVRYLSVPCPSCAAETGQGCVTVAGNTLRIEAGLPTGPHASRKRMAVRRFNEERSKS